MNERQLAGFTAKLLGTPEPEPAEDHAEPEPAQVKEPEPAPEPDNEAIRANNENLLRVSSVVNDLHTLIDETMQRVTQTTLDQITDMRAKLNDLEATLIADSARVRSEIRTFVGLGQDSMRFVAYVGNRIHAFHAERPAGAEVTRAAPNLHVLNTQLAARSDRAAG